MLGEKLMRLRKKQGYSQQEVADKLSVSRQTISNWECDQALPAVDKAMELAQLYNISLDDLMENEIEIVSNNKTKDLHLLQYLIGKTCTLECTLVPVGVDQKQHLEICRDIAQRFNGIYGDVFTIPEPYIAKVGAKIMSLQEPTKKMSKSDPEETYVALLDEPDVIRRKIKRAVTDSDGEIRYDPENKPGVSNLLSILSALGAGSMESLCQEMAGKGYGELKNRTADCIIAALEPLQREYKRIIADKAYLQNLINTNAEKAAYRANKTLRKVQKKIGFASRG